MTRSAPHAAQSLVPRALTVYGRSARPCVIVGPEWIGRFLHSFLVGCDYAVVRVVLILLNSSLVLILNARQHGLILCIDPIGLLYYLLGCICNGCTECLHFGITSLRFAAGSLVTSKCLLRKKRVV